MKLRCKCSRIKVHLLAGGVQEHRLIGKPSCKACHGTGMTIGCPACLGAGLTLGGTKCVPCGASGRVSAPGPAPNRVKAVNS